MYVMFLPSVGDVCHVFAISWRCISCVMSTFGALIVTLVLEVFDVFHLSWYRFMRLPFGGISTVVSTVLYPVLYFPTVSGWELCRTGQLTVHPFLQWKWNLVIGFFHRFMQSVFNLFVLELPLLFLCGAVMIHFEGYESFSGGQRPYLDYPISYIFGQFWSLS